MSAAFRFEVTKPPAVGPLETAFRFAVLVDDIIRALGQSGVTRPEIFEISAVLTELAAVVVHGVDTEASAEFRAGLISVYRRHALILRRIGECLTSAPDAGDPERIEALRGLAEREAALLKELQALRNLDVDVHMPAGLDQKAN